MQTDRLWSIEVPWNHQRLRAFEPTPAEVLAAAPLLAEFYNDSHNSAMMTNTRALTVDDVVETFDAFHAAGDHPFLLERDGELMGDADFRKVEGPEAEFAIMIGQRAQQSRGLGTRYGALVHIAALRVFKFERVYATVIPPNIASRRMLEKLGYRLDPSSRAAFFTDGEDDIAMSLDMIQFERTYADLLAEAIIIPRVLSPD